MSENWWEKSWTRQGGTWALVVQWRLGLGLTVQCWPGTWVGEATLVLGLFAITFRWWRSDPNA